MAPSAKCANEPGSSRSTSIIRKASYVALLERAPRSCSIEYLTSFFVEGTPKSIEVLTAISSFISPLYRLNSISVKCHELCSVPLFHFTIDCLFLLENAIDDDIPISTLRHVNLQ
jgi:hypothetical protein